MPRAEGEGRRVVLLGGEAGSGKSRLVREFAAEAAGDGALVLYGACDAVVRTPYGPFVEALDQLARVIEPDELRAALGTAGGELTRLLPDLPARVGELPAAGRGRSRHGAPPAAHRGDRPARGRQPARPVLLVLEDGHWADAPTLLLLRHLARAGRAARACCCSPPSATPRPTSRRRSSETLADLRRSDDVVRLRLAGLSDDEVAEFVRHAPRAAPAPARRSSRGRSATSPTATRSWSASCGARWSRPGVVEVADGTIRLTRPLTELGTPESVREVVSQRLARLAPRTTDLLELAATAGAEFELDVVRRAAGARRSPSCSPRSTRPSAAG